MASAYDLLMGCGKNAVLDVDQEFPLQVLRWPFLAQRTSEKPQRVTINARSWEQALHFLVRDGWFPIDEDHPHNVLAPRAA